MWIERPTPLKPIACAAKNDKATNLLRQLLEYSENALTQLQGVASDKHVVIEGPIESLPWCDGVIYLGKEPDEPRLWMNTTLQSKDPSMWLRQKLIDSQHLNPPLVLLSSKEAQTEVISMARSTPLSRNTIQQWLGPQPTR